jgi:hypothetical protein
MKSLISVLLTITISQLTFGQSISIKDYYLPETGKNVSSFFKPNLDGISRKIYYKKNDTGYEIYDANFIQGMLAYTKTNSVTISTDEVGIKTSLAWSAVADTKQYDFSPINIILKMPPIGKTISWFYYDGNDKEKCIASWVTITYYGKIRKAIKVVKLIEALNIREVEYYVKGIGLWKTDLEENGWIKNIEKLESLGYDPSYAPSQILENDTLRHDEIPPPVEMPIFKETEKNRTDNKADNNTKTSSTYDLLIDKKIFADTNRFGNKVSFITESFKNKKGETKEEKGDRYFIFDKHNIYMILNGEVIKVWHQLKIKSEDESTIITTKEGEQIVEDLTEIYIDYKSGKSIDYSADESVPLKNVFVQSQYLK